MNSTSKFPFGGTEPEPSSVKQEAQTNDKEMDILFARIAEAVEFLMSMGAKRIEIRTPPQFPEISIFTPDIALSKADSLRLLRLMAGSD